MASGAVGGEIRFDAERLDAVADRMQEFVEHKQLAGAVTLAATRDRVVHLQATGIADLEQGRPMTTDSIFRIASMTKLVTATALMMLVDEGKVAVDDPIAKYIPAFKNQKLKDGSAVRPVTIRDAVTHTAGLYRPRSEGQTLEEIADEVGRAPLAFPPGSKWQYSSGMTVAGRIIEVVSGLEYDQFLLQRIFKPLGMKDTTFVLTADQARRLATTYEPGAEGGLAATTHRFASLDPTVRRTPNPSGGLFSTAGDLVRFYQMVLNGGQFEGRRFLTVGAVQEMTTVHSGDVVTGFTPGNGWGLGWCVVRQPQGVTRLLFPGTFGHGGAFGTQAWIDARRGVIFLLLIQRSKFGNADGSDVRDAFQEQVVSARRGSDSENARFTKYFGYDQAVELTGGRTRVVLCPQAGGRVLEYSLNGKNALYFDDAEKSWRPGKSVPLSAGRFDIGPELVIPKRPTLWSGEWTAEITGPRSARLVSRHDPATGVQLMRDFQLDETDSRLTCTQTIMNVAKRPVEWCHWSRTFATGNGICVIPLTAPSRFPNKFVMYEEGGLINFHAKDPNIRERDGFLEIIGVPRRPKLGFDSYAGWMAYVTRDDLLFAKRFKTDRDRVYNEAAGLTVSVWYPEDRRVELEPIGPRERLLPGETASFTEEWSLASFKFPDTGQVDLKKLNEVVNGASKE